MEETPHILLAAPSGAGSSRPTGSLPVIPFSVLDLSPIIAGGDAGLAFRNSLDLAQHTERWGYLRYWMAEHHNMPGIASAATSVVIAHVAGGTKTIRVGAGGIMLPNHSPMVIAEQFGTLATLFPGRIDLGLDRAPGTDQRTLRALRRNLEQQSISRATWSSCAICSAHRRRPDGRGCSLRLALRTAGADAGGIDLSRAVRALSATRQAIRLSAF